MDRLEIFFLNLNRKILIFPFLISIFEFGAKAGTGVPSVPDISIKNSGSAPQSPVKVKKLSGVPTYEIFKAPQGKIPRLNIGNEPELEFQLVNLKVIDLPNKKFQLQKKDSPQIISINMKTLSASNVNQSKILVSDKNLKTVPELKAIKEIKDPELKTAEPKTLSVVDFKPQDLRLLEALIFLEYLNNYEMALAEFSELLSDKDYQWEARYHYSRAAKSLGLYTEMRSQLLKIAKNAPKDLKKNATELLAQSIEYLDTQDMKEIEPLVQNHEIDISNNQAYNFFRAKYFLEQGQLGIVEDALSLIQEKSKYYQDALLISALLNYRQAKIETSMRDLETLLKVTPQGAPIRSVGAMTLARIQFQKSQYKEAYKTYLEVDKNHALWLQAMVEQAWAQILNHDYEGAAGNMFSLHTDFFKNAYNPESYVVRTVGYLNLCQFGDAIQVLSNMGRRYGPIYNKLEAYQGKKDNPALYETIRQLLKNPELKEVDGIPRSFIIELARHPHFINSQKHINAYEDEITKFNQISLNLIQREKDLIKKQNELTTQLSKIKQDQHEQKISPEKLKELKAIESSIERKLIAQKIETQNANKARAAVKDVREKSFSRLDQEKSEIKQDVSKFLNQRFVILSKSLREILDHNDVLNYEIYSGAGEQLRYQSAGGTGAQNDRPQLKPEKDKSTTWNFKGEIWEDEIGHFRSSLKSVCAPDDGKN